MGEHDLNTDEGTAAAAPMPGGSTALTFAPAVPAPDGPEHTGPRSGPAHHAAARAGSTRLVPWITALIGTAGVALAAGSLWGAGRMHGPPRTFALVAAVAAAVAVLISLGALLVRLVATTVPAGGSRRPARRPWATVAAGAVLAVALVLTGTAVAVAVIGPTAGATPRLIVATTRAADGSRSIQVDATVGGLAVGTPIAMSLTGLTDEGVKPVLASTVQRANGDATSTVRLSALVPATPDVPKVQVDVTVTGRLCQAVVPVQTVIAPDAVAVICRSV
jgi:hypothetical protein